MISILPVLFWVTGVGSKKIKAGQKRNILADRLTELVYMQHFPLLCTKKYIPLEKPFWDLLYWKIWSWRLERKHLKQRNKYHCPVPQWNPNCMKCLTVRSRCSIGDCLLSCFSSSAGWNYRYFHSLTTTVLVYGKYVTGGGTTHTRGTNLPPGKLNIKPGAPLSLYYGI